MEEAFAILSFKETSQRRFKKICSC